MDNYSENEAPKARRAAARRGQGKEAAPGAILQEICSLVPAFSYQGGELRFTTNAIPFRVEAPLPNLIKAFSLVERLPEDYKFFFSPFVEPMRKHACPRLAEFDLPAGVRCPELKGRGGACGYCGEKAACPFADNFPAPRYILKSVLILTKIFQEFYTMITDKGKDGGPAPKVTYKVIEPNGKTTYRTTYRRRCNIASKGKPAAYVYVTIADCRRELTAFDISIMLAGCSWVAQGVTMFYAEDILSAYNHLPQSWRRRPYTENQLNAVIDSMDCLITANVTIDCREQVKGQTYPNLAEMYKSPLIPGWYKVFNTNAGGKRTFFVITDRLPYLDYAQAIKQIAYIPYSKLSPEGRHYHRSQEKGIYSWYLAIRIAAAAQTTNKGKNKTKISLEKLFQKLGIDERITAAAAGKSENYTKDAYKHEREKIAAVLNDFQAGGFITSWNWDPAPGADAKSAKIKNVVFTLADIAEIEEG